jgi:hypothetical protein
VWYIVTDVADTTTFEICKQYTNVVVLFFNFKSNNAVFNKGGAVRMAQQFVHKLHKNDYILILDSDIILPSDFQDVIYDLTPLRSDILYGCRRLVFKTIQDFNLNLKVPIAVEPVCIGFFQLYKTHQLYENSIDCSECDMHFIQKFKGVIVIPNTLVAHLGETGVNWQGRKT